MADPRGIEALKWLQIYKRLTSKDPATLTAAEKTQVADLESKLATLIEPQSTGVGPPRREALRVTTRFEVAVKDAGHMKKMFIKNISGGGVYIEDKNPPEVGTRLELDLALPNFQKVVHTLVEVAWRNTTGAGGLPPGMGVKFISLPTDARKKIQELVTEAVQQVIQGKKP